MIKHSPMWPVEVQVQFSVTQIKNVYQKEYKYIVTIDFERFVYHIYSYKRNKLLVFKY